jgi:hypothetical protein
VYSVFSARYNISRLKFRQILEPKTGCLCFTVPELPRLDNLIGFAPLGRHYTDGVFYSYLFAGRIGNRQKETDCFGLSAVFTFLAEPPCSANGQMGTGRKRYYHIPLARAQVWLNIADDMVLPGATTGWFDITRNSLMPVGSKRIPDFTVSFAGY